MMITVVAHINAPILKVWELWNKPEHITKWYNASEDWHTPTATNDLQIGGKFLYRMEAKDGSFGFDFIGTYDTVLVNELIKYVIEDGRKVTIHFEENAGITTVTETFEPENENSLELQQTGWQAILDSFKRYVEAIAG